MTRRRHRSRVPGTRAPRYRREIATAGDPVASLTTAMLEMPVRPGEIWDLGIGHDDGCPALRWQRLDACDCEIVSLDGRRVA